MGVTANVIRFAAILHLSCISILWSVHLQLVQVWDADEHHPITTAQREAFCFQHTSKHKIYNTSMSPSHMVPSCLCVLTGCDYEEQQNEPPDFYTIKLEPPKNDNTVAAIGF